MSKRAVYHVVHSEIGWKVELEGTGVLNTTDTKGQATAWAKAQAKATQPSQIRVHGKDGKIQTEWTYGQDPTKYPGITE